MALLVAQARTRVRCRPNSTRSINASALCVESDSPSTLLGKKTRSTLCHNQRKIDAYGLTETTESTICAAAGCSADAQRSCSCIDLSTLQKVCGKADAGKPASLATIARIHYAGHALCPSVRHAKCSASLCSSRLPASLVSGRLFALHLRMDFRSLDRNVRHHLFKFQTF
jgi:hypothetical protein